MFAKSRFNPAPGIMDFWEEFRKPNPYRWPILVISSLPFVLIMVWATSETVYLPPERPNVTFISSFAPDRSDAEIVASNIENQAEKDEVAARQAEYEERKREAYRALGAASGFDVEEMEARAEADRAREEAQEAARRAERYPDREQQPVPGSAEPISASEGGTQ
ncbi:MAG: hypothetical protein ABJP48_10720 [Erythrobacter sp.]